MTAAKTFWKLLRVMTLTIYIKVIEVTVNLDIYSLILIEKNLLMLCSILNQI